MTSKKKNKPKSPKETERTGIKKGNSFKKFIYTATVKKRTAFVICLHLFQGPMITANKNKENSRVFEPKIK